MSGSPLKSREVQDLRVTFFWPIEVTTALATTFAEWKPPTERWKTCDFETSSWGSEALKRSGSETPGSWFQEFDDEHRCRFYGWDELRYAEQVYFTPAIRELLYGSERKVWQRTDIRALTVDLHDWGTESSKREDGNNDVYVVRRATTVDLWVPRVQLYWFRDVDVAVLAVEIATHDFSDTGNRGSRACFDDSGAAELDFDTALRLLNRFRRLFVPYYKYEDAEGEKTETSGKQLRLGEFPAGVKWRSGPTYQVDFEQGYSAESSPPRASLSTVTPHWSYLTMGSPLERSVNESPLGDDRLPYLAHVGVHPEWFSQTVNERRNDSIRLCFADEPGNPANPPYARDFLENFERDHCYDRFWSPGDGWQTRWMSCGYALTALVNGSEPFCNSTFRGTAAQVRHHYFQMCLIAHVQNTALHILSKRLATAYRGASSRSGRDGIRDLYRKWLSFRHEVWFLQVSNQLQATEMFPILQRHLGLAPLFEQVREEADEIVAYVAAIEEGEQTREALAQTQESLIQTRMATALSKVATVGLAFATVAGLLGMNVPDLSAEEFWTWFLILGEAAVLIVAAILWMWLPRQKKDPASREDLGLGQPQKLLPAPPSTHRAGNDRKSVGKKGE